MKKIALGALVALAIPAGTAMAQDSETPTPKQSASQACRDERSQVGAEVFRATYGTNKNKKNAFGKCVSSQQKETMKEETEENVSAAKACRTERSEMGSEAFAQKYGTNENKRNAFGKCVSRTEKAQDGEDDES